MSRQQLHQPNQPHQPATSPAGGSGAAAGPAAASAQYQQQHATTSPPAEQRLLSVDHLPASARSAHTAATRPAAQPGRLVPATVASWNVLNHRHYEKHCRTAVMPLEVRQQKFCEIFRSVLFSSPHQHQQQPQQQQQQQPVVDILCLQEVNWAHVRGAIEAVQQQQEQQQRQQHAAGSGRFEILLSSSHESSTGDDAVDHDDDGVAILFNSARFKLVGRPRAILLSGERGGPGKSALVALFEDAATNCLVAVCSAHISWSRNAQERERNLAACIDLIASDYVPPSSAAERERALENDKTNNNNQQAQASQQARRNFIIGCDANHVYDAEQSASLFRQTDFRDATRLIEWSAWNNCAKKIDYVLCRGPHLHVPDAVDDNQQQQQRVIPADPLKLLRHDPLGGRGSGRGGGRGRGGRRDGRGRDGGGDAPQQQEQQQEPQQQLQEENQTAAAVQVEEEAIATDAFPSDHAIILTQILIGVVA